MADPLPSPPSPPPPDPKPPLPAAGKPPIKRKTTTTSSPNKRPNIPPPFPDDDLEDTATSKSKEIPQDVDIEDIEVMESLLDYRSTKGVFPFEDPAAMKSFLRPWLLLHYGNEDGWKKKLEHVKTKFTRSSYPIGDGERKEFELWMKIWGNDNEGGGGDAGDPIGDGERKEFELWMKSWGNDNEGGGGDAGDPSGGGL